MNSNHVAPLASYNTVHAISKLCEHRNCSFKTMFSEWKSQSKCNYWYKNKNLLHCNTFSYLRMYVSGSITLLHNQLNMSLLQGHQLRRILGMNDVLPEARSLSDVKDWSFGALAVLILCSVQTERADHYRNLVSQGAVIISILHMGIEVQSKDFFECSQWKF